jgi:hypothetical protein
MVDGMCYTGADMHENFEIHFLVLAGALMFLAAYGFGLVF